MATGIYSPADSRAEIALPIKSGFNGHDNPYVLGIVDGNPTYIVTTNRRKREIILLLDKELEEIRELVIPRTMVCRYSMGNTERWDNWDWDAYLDSLKSLDKRPNHNCPDSFTIYTDRDGPMYMDEIVGLFGTPVDENRVKLRGMDQEMHWDACFIEEFMNLLETPEIRKKLRNMGVEYETGP